MHGFRLRGRHIATVLLAVAVGALSLPVVAGAFTAITTRVSVSSTGAQGNALSRNPAISPNGRFVGFSTTADNIVVGDTNGVADVFVHDRLTGETSLVSVTTTGTQGDGDSYAPALSQDGRFVAFVSEATNLVEGDTNGKADAFVQDRTTGEIVRASVDSSGLQGDGEVAAPLSISWDGRCVAFAADSTNLVAGDLNAAHDAFVHDLATGVTTLVSRDSLGVQGVLGSRIGFASLSRDGRYVTFESAATNLVANDTNGYTDIFVHDRSTGATVRASVSSSGTEGADFSRAPSISADGRWIAYMSLAENLVADDNNTMWDIFLFDRVTKKTTRVNVDSAGTQANDVSQYPTVSADGRFIAFDSIASNLVDGDTNGGDDAFVRDRIAGTTTRVSVDALGAQGGDGTWLAMISADGRNVAYRSPANNLVFGDTNAVDDVFVYDRPTVATSVSLKTSATSTRIGVTRKLSGVVTPLGMVGRAIKVYVMKPGKTTWSVLKSVTVKKVAGKAVWSYNHTFKAGMKKGAYKFKAVVPAKTGFFLKSTSSVRTIRLK